jgi:hypothetical protein
MGNAVGAERSRRSGPEPFDEVWYLQDNDDVRAAVARGDWRSSYAHYCAVGRNRGRSGSPEVDETWYGNAYRNPTLLFPMLDSNYDHWFPGGS